MEAAAAGVAAERPQGLAVHLETLSHLLKQLSISQAMPLKK